MNYCGKIFRLKDLAQGSHGPLLWLFSELDAIAAELSTCSKSTFFPLMASSTPLVLDHALTAGWVGDLLYAIKY